MSLSERIRSGCEAAPWVSDEVQNLEATNAELCEEVQKLKAINAELLEALRGLAAVAGLAPIKGNLEALQEAYDIAWAAIAKAKGEQP